MKKAANVLRMIAVVGMILTLLVAGAQAEVPAVVMNTTMNVYFGPTTQSEWIGSLPQGTEVSVQACNGEWTLVTYMGRAGFVKTEDLCSLQPMEGKVNADALVLYITPDDLTPRVAMLSAGTTVYVRGARYGYWLVSNADMTVLAYIPMQFVAM